MTTKPGSYHKFIENAFQHTNIVKPQTNDFIKKLSLQGLSLYTRIPGFYMVDYTPNKYVYADYSPEKAAGYASKSSADKGPVNFTALWNRNDFKVFNEKIFPETIQFLKQRPVSDYPDFSFSFNYRVKAINGEYLTLLQRSTYFSNSEDGNLLAAIGTIVNITGYKIDTSIIHTAEKTDRNFPCLSEGALFKSVYYPDKDDGVLSKRELEILAAIYEGLTSKDIAHKFNVSINTVNNQRKKMLHKTNTNNAAELIHYAMNKGLL